MFDAFRALSAEERRRHLDGYLDYLRARDGELDLAGRRLSLRESYFEDLARKPVEWAGDVHHDGFFQHFLGAGTPEIDARTVWLVAVAKANESENYGVELEIERFLGRGPERADLRELYLILEELYHTRILVEACRTCGLDLSLRKPPWHRRWMIRLIYYLPEGVRWIPVLCGETLACAVLKLLRDRCDLFSEQPEVEERLRSLLTEIWVDEVFHVAFLRARLAPWALRLSRLLVPLVARSLMSDVPQLRKLGCGLGELIARARSGTEIPPGADWMQPDPRS